jgi:hypothetical protein
MAIAKARRVTRIFSCTIAILLFPTLSPSDRPEFPGGPTDDQRLFQAVEPADPQQSIAI